MWSDPIADMLTRIRNGVRIKSKQIQMPYSGMKAGIAQVLKDEGYIEGFDRIDDAKQGMLRIDLKYGPRGEQLIHSIRRESKVGCRVYRGVTELPRVLNGMGIAVVSTHKGLMSDRRCRQEKLGGELVCTLY